VEQLLDRTVGYDLQLGGAAYLRGGAVGDAPQLEVALLVEAEVGRVGASRVAAELCQAEVARQLLSVLTPARKKRVRTLPPKS
jgi:hypothetical protein